MQQHYCPISYALCLCSKKIKIWSSPEYPPCPLFNVGQATTITHKNNLVLSNIDPRDKTSTRKVKIGNLPNIFDDDCVRIDNCLLTLVKHVAFNISLRFLTLEIY